MKKTYNFDQITVFFKHTDCYGCVHPYNYFEWTSYVREDFFQCTVPNFKDIVFRSIKMMTVKINCKICNDAEFGDHIAAHLSVSKIKKVSFDMVIKFINTKNNNLLCQTDHTIVFVDSKTNEFAAIPNEMKRIIIKYVDDDVLPTPRHKNA